MSVCSCGHDVEAHNGAGICTQCSCVVFAKSFNEPLNSVECIELLKKRIIFVLPGEPTPARRDVYLEWIALCDAAIAAMQ